MLDTHNAVIQRVRNKLHKLFAPAKETSEPYKCYMNVIGRSIALIAELYKDYLGKIKSLIL